MVNSIFDIIKEEETPQGEKGFFAIADDISEPKDDSFFESVKDYGKTILKGTAEGLGRLGRIMGPTISEISSSEQLERQTKGLDKLLPTDEGYVQKSIRRGLKEAPTVLSFPGSKIATLPRAILAGFSGQGAEDLGLPEWAQAAAEITAYIGPDVTKKLLEKGKSSEIIKEARKLGLNDKQIAPLIQSEFKQKWLSKLTPRRGQTQKILEESKKGLGEVYQTIIKDPKVADKVLTESGSERVVEKLRSVMKDMPSSVRNTIQQDFRDLSSKPVTTKSLVNFYQDVNHALGNNTKQLSQLKGPIRQALGEISPQLEKDFNTVNKLYSKYSDIQSRLKPTLVTDLVQAAKALQVIGGVAFGYLPILGEVAGHAALSKMSQQMLLNPRYQQIGQKIVSAVQQNKFGIAMKSVKALQKEINEVDTELAKELEDISEDDLKSLFKDQV